MSFFKYIKDKSISILLYTLMIILICLILNAFKESKIVITVILLLLIITGVIILVYNYLRKSSFYTAIINNMKQLNQKYLILETLPAPNTYEEKIMVEMLYDINKSMIENVNKIYKSKEDFKEYVEMWIHEVKIPIASMVLKCHNDKDKYSEEFLSLIRKVDNYIDTILYYTRSEYAEKDFIINRFNLKDIIKDVSIKNKDDLLENNISLKTNNLNFFVYSDKKWIEFIISQIISNSIKYKKEKESMIVIEGFKTEEKTVLSIYDNGIGINAKDINRVFDKSFTGANGRLGQKSTGMGLYISKKLCDKLGHKIYIESKEKEYTKVFIEFGNNTFFDV